VFRNEAHEELSANGEKAKSNGRKK